METTERRAIAIECASRIYQGAGVETLGSVQDFKSLAPHEVDEIIALAKTFDTWIATGRRRELSGA